MTCLYSIHSFIRHYHLKHAKYVTCAFLLYCIPPQTFQNYLVLFFVLPNIELIGALAQSYYIIIIIN